MIRTQGLTHVHLIVNDLDRSLRFHTEVFGLEEQYRDGPTMVFLRSPGATDSITLNARPDDPRIGRGGIDHIGFRLIDKTDLEDAIRQHIRASELAKAGTLRNADPELLTMNISERDIPQLVAFLRTLEEVPEDEYRDYRITNVRIRQDPMGEQTYDN